MNKRIKAKKQNRIITPISVKPLADYWLLLTFSDRPKKQMAFNVLPLVNELDTLKPLLDKDLFAKVYCDGVSVAWNDELDICPEYLYSKSISYESYLQSDGK